MATILSVLLLLPIGAVSQGLKSGSISGRVTECSGGPLPGAEVALMGPDSDKAQIAATADNGRYRFAGVAAGSYALQVRMPHYLTFLHTSLQLPVGGELTFDVMMSFDAMSGIYLSTTIGSWDMDLPALWRNVDAVAYLRFQKTLGARRTPQTDTKCENIYVEHRALVLEVFRRCFGKPDASILNFLQAVPSPGYAGMNTRTAGDQTYAPGTELVAFMQWDKSEAAFLAYFTLPIREGRVQSLHIPEIESGMTLEAFLKKLRAMME